MSFPFEKDPRFAKLTYAEQQQLRLEAAATMFSKDQRFLNLAENEKLILMQDVMKSPPVFENPEIGEAATRLGDPVAFQTLANINKSFGLTGIVTSFLSKIIPEGQLVKDMLFGADADKLSAYVQNKIDSNQSLGPIAKMLPKLGSIVGFIGDLVSYGKATGLIPTKTIAGLLQGASERAVENLVKAGAKGTKIGLAQWLIGDLAPYAARAGATGLTGILRDQYVMPILNGKNPDTSIVDMAKTFGLYAAGDTLFWNILGWGGPFLRLGGKVLGTFGRSSAKLSESLYTVDTKGKRKPFTPEQMAEYEAAVIRGDLSDVQFQMASPAVQDHLTSVRESQMYAANPELAARDPYGKTVLAARSIGLSVVRAEGGGFRVRHVADPGVVVEVKTLGQLDEALIQYMRARKDFFDLDQLRLDPLRGHLVKMMDAQDGISDALKAAKVEGTSKNFVDLNARPSMSPIEAEAVKASTFSTSGQNVVADVFRIPLSETTLEKFRTRKLFVNEGQEAYIRSKESTLLPSGSDAIPLSKEGGSPNAFAMAKNVASLEDFKAAQAWAKRAKDAGSKEAEANLTTTALRRAGYDGANLPDGSLLALYPERQIKILDNTISPQTGKRGFKAPAAIKEENVSLSLSSLKGSVSDALVGKDNRMLSALLKSSDGKINPERSARAASIMLKRLGAKDSRAAITVLDDATEISIRTTKNGLRIIVPKDMKNFPKKLALALADHVAAEGKTVRKIKEVEAKVTLPEDAIKLKNLKTWFGNLIEQTRPMKEWAAKNAQGLDPIEAIKKLALSEMTSQVLKTTLAKFGVRVIGNEPKLKAMKGGKVIAAGRTGEELLTNAGIDLDKIPSKYAPKVVGLNPDSVVFEVKGIGVKGGPKDIWKLLDNFTDISHTAAAQKIFSGGEGSITFARSRGYMVEMPAYGIRQRFTSLKAAREFIGGEWKSWANLSDRIEAAGGILRHENGKYVVHVGGSKYEAKTLPELGKIMKENLPNPETVPELVAEDAHLYYKEDSPLLDFEAFRPRYNDIPLESTSENFLSKISMLIKPMTSWVSDYARKTGNIEVLRSFNDMEQGVRLSSRDTDLMLELVNEMEKSLGLNRKNFRGKTEGLFHLLGEPNVENRAGIIEKFQLGEKELVVEKRLRAMLGENPNDPTGLFAKFGMDPWKFIYNYMSRVRAVTDESSILHLNQPEATEEILKKAFGNDSVPNDIRFWAENMRESDVVSFALDTNVFSVMRRYITRGNLRLYVGEPWRNMVGLLNQPGVDKNLRWRVFRYMDILQGGGRTDMEKMAQSWSGSFSRALEEGKGKFKANIQRTFGQEHKAELTLVEAQRRGREKAINAMHSDVLKMMYSLSYTTHLGLRGYIAVRNFGQVYQTVGPLIGNSYLQESIRFAASKKGPAYLAELRRRGVVHQALPLVNELSDAEHLLGKLADHSLSMFKTADDYSRFVGYKSGELKFEAGLKIFKNVDMTNAKQFAEFVGTNLYGPEMNSRILEALVAGKSDVAKHIFSNATQERALFLMRREQSPVMFHGVIGKMFGQYGTFATQYVQFVAQTWKYATKGQKAAFAARWIGNSAALAAGAYAIGLRAKDWMPWAPAQFTGGPLFNLAVDLVHSIGSDYQGRQARGELNRMLPFDLNKLIKGEGLQLQPPVGMLGYYQIRTLMKMGEYAGQGDAWKTFLALLSAPIRSE